MTKACIYLRLSRDDGDNVESNSIINQRSLLRDYAKNHDFTILEEFVDDGISGLTFNRPDFNRMMEGLMRILLILLLLRTCLVLCVTIWN